jgi:hypothetical protein
MVVETRYVFRASFPNIFTETLHADRNSKLQAFLGKLQVIKLAKKRPVIYMTNILGRSNKTQSTNTTLGHRKLAYSLTLFILKI